MNSLEIIQRICSWKIRFNTAKFKMMRKFFVSLIEFQMIMENNAQPEWKTFIPGVESHRRGRIRPHAQIPLTATDRGDMEIRQGLRRFLT